MAVYVDDAFMPFGRMKMSHMVADSPEELLVMADTIGVQRRWIQHQGTWSEHFDVCLEKRRLAIEAGAVPITYIKLGLILAARRKL